MVKFLNAGLMFLKVVLVPKKKESDTSLYSIVKLLSTCPPSHSGSSQPMVMLSCSTLMAVGLLGAGGVTAHRRWSKAYVVDMVSVLPIPQGSWLM